MEENEKKDISAPLPETQVIPAQKKTHVDKLAEIFLPEDLDSIGNRIMKQVIMPKIMDSFSYILHASLDLMFGTNFSGVNKSAPASDSNVSTWQHTNYQNRNTAASQQAVGTMQVIPARQGVYDYATVQFQKPEDAQRVVSNMQSAINRNGYVTVGQYMEFSNAKPIKEDYNYGWTSLQGVYAIETDNRQYPYRLVLPNPISLGTQSGKPIYFF